ncbi:MAG: hypothetical protein JO369_05185 [Paucibacter sp.]|nr:hypothetical protein [Roseateles sp.]
MFALTALMLGSSCHADEAAARPLPAASAPAPMLAPTTPRQPPSPQEMQKIMDATMGAMVPMMGRMTEAMIEAQLSIAAQPQTAERIATFKRNLYEALIKKGFTKAEALQLVIATGIPSATPASK